MKMMAVAAIVCGLAMGVAAQESAEEQLETLFRNQNNGNRCKKRRDYL